MIFIYGTHAREMLTERKIDRLWVERTVLEPDTTEPDPGHGGRTRAYRIVPERDGRVLRVVYEQEHDTVRIVTLFLDRGRKRR